MQKLLSAGALALGCWAGAAQAAPVIGIAFTPGGSGSAPGTTAIQTFDNVTVAAGAQGPSIGTNAYIYSSSVAGIAAKPLTATTNFGAVLAGGSYAVTGLSTNLFSFVVGSLDSYNRLVLNFSDGSTTTLQGSQIIGLANFPVDVTNTSLGGSNTSPLVNGLVTYTYTGALLNSATFSSDSQNSFEFDTLSAAVPEPAAWGMMILGLGLVGGALRRRTARVRFA